MNVRVRYDLTERPAAPHLSIVAVSRNDDHGGDMRARMQHFVNGLFAQCRRHRLDAELVLVEWNPPADRPPLAAAIEWPADFGPARARVVTVPHAIHALVSSGSEFPLFQMIGKNVGIRRARGRFVLATNVDILLDDALVRYLRDRLEPGTMLRVDRYDVPSDLPRRVPFVEVLADCARRFFQVNSRFGTFDIRAREMLAVGPGFKAQCLAAYFEARMFGPWTGARRLLWFAARSVRYRVSARIEDLPRCAAWLRAALPRVLPFYTLHTRIARRFKPSQWSHRVAVRWRRWAAARWRLGRRVLAMMFPVSAKDQRLRSLRRLHTNACGDFTLLAREDWFRLQGYPEWPIHSWHLDSAFLYAAAANGMVEVALGRGYRIYHIDHGAGWTPSSGRELFARLDARGIRYLSNQDLERWRQMTAAFPERALVNGPDWGLAACQLTEREILPRAQTEKDYDASAVQTVA
jgi:hypothetical protein